MPAVAAITNPHHLRLGGHAAVVRLVDAFYAAMDRRVDARTIRAMHAPDLERTKTTLVMYLDEWLGGPKHYSAERGAPRLRRVHLPLAIDADAVGAWLACMRQALDQTSDDTALRDELMAAFSKIAHHLQNTEIPPNHRSPR